MSEPLIYGDSHGSHNTGKLTPAEERKFYRTLPNDIQSLQREKNDNLAKIRNLENAQNKCDTALANVTQEEKQITQLTPQQCEFAEIHRESVLADLHTQRQRLTNIRSQLGEQIAQTQARNREIEANIASKQAEIEALEKKAADPISREADAVGGLTEQKELQLAKERSCRPSIAILVAGCVIVLGIALMFIPGSPANIIGNNESKKKPNENNPEAENAFTVSGAYFLEGYDVLGAGAAPVDSWTGGSSTSYADDNTRLRNVVESIAAANKNVDATVQTQGAQVSAGKQTLGNAFNGLQLAMPASESLYFSGPTGPALSYIFQLAVANATADSSVNTANTMHDNARQHGHRLTALAQQYSEALRVVSSANSTAPTRPSTSGTGSTISVSTPALFPELAVAATPATSGAASTVNGWGQHRAPATLTDRVALVGGLASACRHASSGPTLFQGGKTLPPQPAQPAAHIDTATYQNGSVAAGVGGDLVSPTTAPVPGPDSSLLSAAVPGL